MNLTQIDSKGTTAGQPHLDLDLLFRQHSRRLRGAVHSNVNAGEEVVDEACQQAWANLVAHADQVDPEHVFSWLVTTATRAALKQLQRASRWRSLDAALDLGEEISAPSGVQSHERLVARETLRAIGRLPARQQRALWLRGLGLSYRELAAHEGCTLRTVQRQLLWARQGVKAQVGALGSWA